MELITCKNCGSRDFFEAEGFTVCEYCDSKYKIPSSVDVEHESVIEIHSDIEILLEKCRKNPSDSRRIANLILDIDPHNEEARYYLSQ
jgi:uncharacterized Zn finger protein (UPF0148 family)